MNRPRRAREALALALCLQSPACHRAHSRVPDASGTSPAPVVATRVPIDASGTPPANGRVTFLEDDVPAARARALAEHKTLLVDAWATWCHTCLSMRHFVLSDPGLGALNDRVVFASVDTDRAQNAEFLAHHPVRVWPSFYVLDPRDDRVLGYLPGSASPRAFRAFVEDSLRSTGAAAPADAAVSEARAAAGAGDWATAAGAYERAISAAPPDWPARSATVYAWMFALYQNRDWQSCSRVGREHLPDVASVSDTDGYSWYLLQCLQHEPPSPEVTTTRLAISDHLRAVLDRPDGDASVDDRASAMETLAQALESSGNTAGARMTRESALGLLERAAREASSPAVAATFDDARVRAYLALNRGEDAVRMLTERERQMPDAPEPAAGLALVFNSLNRYPEARAAVDRALAHSYGPRRLRLLKLRATILGHLGDRAGALATLREEVAGYEALAPGQAAPDALANATLRRDQAERALEGAP